jgi:hypothetical protein
VRYVFGEGYIKIFESYKYNDRKHILNVLEKIRQEAADVGISYKRSNMSYMHEWLAHNWLFDKGLFKDRTADSDLNENESKFRRIVYWIISNILWVF